MKTNVFIILLLVFLMGCVQKECIENEDCKVAEECNMSAHTCQRLIPTRTEELLEECPSGYSIFSEELQLEQGEIEEMLKNGCIDASTNNLLEEACEWDSECCLNLPEIIDAGSARDFVKKYTYCSTMHSFTLGPGAPEGPVVSTEATIPDIRKLKHGYLMYAIPYSVIVKESTVEVTSEPKLVEGWFYLSNSGCVIPCLGKEE